MLLPTRAIRTALIVIPFAFFVIYIVLELLFAAHVGGKVVSGSLRLLDLGDEGTAPAWYAQSLLLVAGLLAAARATLVPRGQERRGWIVIAVALAYVSLDESASIHERVSPAIAAVFGIESGPLRFAWVIPAAIVVVALAIFILPVLRRLPRRAALLLVLAAAIYVGGALGLEIVEGMMIPAGVEDYYRTTGFGFRLVVGIEELLEMLGVSVFILGLFELARTRDDRLLVPSLRVG